MKDIIQILQSHAGGEQRLCLATLVSTSGSVPQVPGSSAIFSEKGLVDGTLGGGIMEGDAERQALEAIRKGKFRCYDFHLDADINDKEGALCGGYAKILVDPDPGKHADCFREMANSLEKGEPGIIITSIPADVKSGLRKYWLEAGQTDPGIIPALEELPGKWPGIEAALSTSMKKGATGTMENKAGDLLFIEPVFPSPKLIIAGAGHIGKALAHQGRLLDFEVTVIDDRAEYANTGNIPDAHRIIVKPIGEAVAEIPKSKDTYIVIVTRGHHDDASALKACIRHDLPYVGMIGSRKKLRLMKEKFISEGWSTREEFERVHAPIGIEIGSVTIQEIALSISAQLVQVRAVRRAGKKRSSIATLILAAGESRRMGKPKMLLPWGASNIIGTVISNAVNALCDHVSVVLGADADKIVATIPDLKVEKVLNSAYRDGMLSSVQAGIRSLPPTTTAVMILLGDQPMISTEIIDRLIERYKKSEKAILIATAKGRRGHPMIFSAKYIPEILSYGQAETLRTIQDKHPEEVEEVETGDPQILRDIDTPQDYENEYKT